VKWEMEKGKGERRKRRFTVHGSRFTVKAGEAVKDETIYSVERGAHSVDKNRVCFLLSAKRSTLNAF